MSRFRPRLSSGEVLAPPRSSASKPEQKAYPPRVETTPVPQFTPPAPRISLPQPTAAPSAAPTLLTTLVGIYILMHVIPWSELVIRIVGIDPKMTLITGAIVSLGVLFSGQIGRFWSLSIAKTWLLLLALMLAASAFGDYPGRSLPFMAQYGIRFHIFPFLICAVAGRGQQLRRLLLWGSWGAVALVLLILKYGELAEGRLIIPNTSLGNPNDLALSLVIAGLFMTSLFYAQSIAIRAVPLLVLPLLVYYILQTGSRANFLTLVLILIATFLTVPKRVKVGVLALAPIIAIAMVLLLPAATKRRLTMIVSNPEEVYNQSDETRATVGSQLARTQLQERAIALTLRNPLLGVGPLMFADAVDVMVREDTQQKSGWQFAHNVYLQVAAENGIAAFLLFIGVMVWMIKTNYQQFRKVSLYPELRAYSGQTLSILLMVIGFGFGIAFGNYIYEAIYPILVGLTAANVLAFREDVKALTGTTP